MRGTKIIINLNAHSDDVKLNVVHKNMITIKILMMIYKYICSNHMIAYFTNLDTQKK